MFVVRDYRLLEYYKNVRSNTPRKFLTLGALIYLVRPRKPLPFKSVVYGLKLGFLKTRLFWAFQIGNVNEGFGYFMPQIYLPSTQLKIPSCDKA